MKFEQKVDRDALIVRLRMANAPFIAGRMFKLTPDELIEHAKWLSKQPKDYRDKVVAKVEEIMDAEV